MKSFLFVCATDQNHLTSSELVFTSTNNAMLHGIIPKCVVHKPFDHVDNIVRCATLFNKTVNCPSRL